MSTLRILLADDDSSHQELIEASIRDHCPRVEIHRVRSGAEFIAAADAQQFDCLVLDFNLADARADELLTRLAARGCTTPVVVVSSAEEQDVVVRSLRSGGADFVPKTEAIAGPVLWERIEAAITRRRQQDRERRQIKRQVRRLARIAETDRLTGLLNRLGVHHLLNGRRGRLDRREDVCLAMMDVDRFKRINDTYGHLCGDTVLARVSEHLKQRCGSQYMACRWGGEEFLVLMPATRLGAAWTWAERLRKALAADRILWEGLSVPVTISIGLTQCTPGEGWEEAMQRADEALLLAKQGGRNRVCSWAMVLLEQIAAGGSVETFTDGEKRLRSLVENARLRLGPMQKSHLLEHGRRVADLASRLAQRLRLNGPSIHEVREAGLLHDLGKCLVPEDLLAKPGPLSGDERALLRKQADFATEVAERAGWLPPGGAADAVRNHHLRFDQHGDRLSPGARIVALADSYDAMTSQRAHRPALTPADAIAVLRKERGRRFAPDAVDAAIQILAPSGPADRMRSSVPQSPLES